MRTSSVDSVVGYLDLITQLNKDLSSNYLWYRGVSSKEYKLIPSIIWRGELGWEQNYIHHFLVSYKAYTDEEYNPWELYALMQHHGLPTRLLDWTKSPLNALYFALTQDPEKSSNRVVYVMPPSELNRQIHNKESVFCPAILENRTIKSGDNQYKDLDEYLPKALQPYEDQQIPSKPIAIETPMNNDRIINQKGCFTLHGSSSLSIDEFEQEDAEREFIVRIELNTKDNREKFLEDLHTLGIDEEFIYQDLDSLSSRIKREQSIRSK